MCTVYLEQVHPLPYIESIFRVLYKIGGNNVPTEVCPDLLITKLGDFYC
jgi:hypothetical protein